MTKRFFPNKNARRSENEGSSERWRVLSHQGCLQDYVQRAPPTPPQHPWQWPKRKKEPTLDRGKGRRRWATPPWRCSDPGSWWWLQSGSASCLFSAGGETEGRHVCQHLWAESGDKDRPQRGRDAFWLGFHLLEYILHVKGRAGPPDTQLPKCFDFSAVLLSQWKHFHILPILFIHILDIFLSSLFFCFFVCLPSNYYFSIFYLFIYIYFTWEFRHSCEVHFIPLVVVLLQPFQLWLQLCFYV